MKNQMGLNGQQNYKTAMITWLVNTIFCSPNMFWTGYEKSTYENHQNVGINSHPKTNLLTQDVVPVRLITVRLCEFFERL